MFINTYSYYIIPATPDDMQGYATCISATKSTDLKKIIQNIISYISISEVLGRWHKTIASCIENLIESEIFPALDPRLASYDL